MCFFFVFFRCRALCGKCVKIFSGHEKVWLASSIFIPMICEEAFSQRRWRSKNKSRVRFFFLLLLLMLCFSLSPFRREQRSNERVSDAIYVMLISIAASMHVHLQHFHLAPSRKYKLTFVRRFRITWWVLSFFLSRSSFLSPSLCHSLGDVPPTRTSAMLESPRMLSINKFRTY